jgi:dTDP-4-amino-4,6-dideoxygalactose transaminase
LEEIKEKKHKIFNQYKSVFENENKISLQLIDTNTEHSEWMFGLRLNTFTTSQKKELELYLFHSGIDTRPMFYEIKKHKYISHIPNKDYNSCILNKQCIILPSYPQLTNGQVNFISDKILKFINNEN